MIEARVAASLTKPATVTPLTLPVAPEAQQACATHSKRVREI